MSCCKGCSCGQTIFYTAPATSPKDAPSDRGMAADLFNAIEAALERPSRGRIRNLVLQITRLAAAPEALRLAAFDAAKKALGR